MVTVISVVLIIVALFMIVTVLFQSSDDSGKSKAKTFEAKLALGTKVAAAVFVVLSLVMLIIG